MKEDFTKGTEIQEDEVFRVEDEMGDDFDIDCDEDEEQTAIDVQSTKVMGGFTFVSPTVADVACIGDADITKPLAGIATDFYGIMSKTKKAKITNFNQRLVSRYLLTIMAMNQLGEYESSFMGVSVDLWNVPKLFENLVFPYAVSLLSDDLYPSITDNVIQYVTDDELESLPLMTYSEFTTATSVIYALLNLRNGAFESLATLRSRKCLNDVKDSLVQDGRITWDSSVDRKFYFLKDGFELYPQHYLIFNIRDYVVQRFTHKWNALYRNGSSDPKAAEKVEAIGSKQLESSNKPGGGTSNVE